MYPRLEIRRSEHAGNRRQIDAILNPSRPDVPAVSTRITIEPGKRGGNPCVWSLRIEVWDVLGWLGAGMTEDQIPDEHPALEKADFAAVYQFAAKNDRKTTFD